jgi:hypothetical protein
LKKPKKVYTGGKISAVDPFRELRPSSSSQVSGGFHLLFPGAELGSELDDLSCVFERDLDLLVLLRENTELVSDCSLAKSPISGIKGL